MVENTSTPRPDSYTTGLPMTTLNTIIEEEKTNARKTFQMEEMPELEALLTTAMQRAYEAGRGEIAEMVEASRKTGNNGEGLPFENSPEIYGNKRIEAWKNGHNTALDTILSKITHKSE